MRKPTDLCLLCKANAATKTNSHIFPKFLSVNFLGPKTTRKGFQIASNNPLLQRPKTVQNSPTEDFILCEECEKYFSVLERISSSTFNNWTIKVNQGEFSITQIVSDYSIIECSSSEKRTVRLLIYSIFWRASISSDALFKNIKLEKEIEDELRLILLDYRTTKQNEYLIQLNQKPIFKVFPIAIMTAESFKDATSNILFVPGFNGAYRLIIDQFSFVLFKSFDEIAVDFFKGTSNNGLDDCKIILFSQKFWEDTIVQPVVDLLSQEVIKNEKKRGL